MNEVSVDLTFNAFIAFYNVKSLGKGIFNPPITVLSFLVLKVSYLFMSLKQALFAFEVVYLFQEIKKIFRTPFVPIIGQFRGCF